jgi:MFS family permease
MWQEGREMLFMLDPNFRPYVADPNFRPYVLLFIGLFLIGLGLASTCSGQAVARFGRSANRIEDPKKFWSLVAVDFIGGALAIGYFLYQRYGAK